MLLCEVSKSLGKTATVKTESMRTDLLSYRRHHWMRAWGQTCCHTGDTTEWEHEDRPVVIQETPLNESMRTDLLSYRRHHWMRAWGQTCCHTGDTTEWEHEDRPVVIQETPLNESMRTDLLSYRRHHWMRAWGQTCCHTGDTTEWEHEDRPVVIQETPLNESMTTDLLSHRRHHWMRAWGQTCCHTGDTTEEVLLYTSKHDIWIMRENICSAPQRTQSHKCVWHTSSSGTHFVTHRTTRRRRLSENGVGWQRLPMRWWLQLVKLLYLARWLYGCTAELTLLHLHAPAVSSTLRTPSQLLHTNTMFL